MDTSLRAALCCGLLLTVQGGLLAAEEASPPKSRNLPDAAQDESPESDAAATSPTSDKTPARKAVEVDIRRLKNGPGGIDVDVRIGRPDQTDTAEAPQSETETYLGLMTSRVPPPLAAQLAHLLGDADGLLVVRVLPDSPAELAGLQQFDVVTAFNGNALSDSQQLKNLILAEEPGTTETLAIVRAAAPQTVAVTVGQRPVPGGIHVITPKNGKLPLAIRVFGRDVYIDRDHVIVPGAKIRWGTRHDDRGPHRRFARRIINASTKDGKTFQVQAKYIDEAGSAQSLELSGTAEEIAQQSDKLPATVRENISTNLERLQSDEDSAPRAFRLRCRPCFHDGQRSLDVHIRRPGADGETRIFDFSYCIGEDDLDDLGQLLEVDDLAEELQDLSQEVRLKLESTLRDFEFPPLRSEVGESQ